MRKIPTGIVGLDKMLGGGYPENSTIIIAGGPGSGKTILSIQFLMRGILEGESAIFLSLGETKDRIQRNVEAFGWDLDQLTFINPVKQAPKHEAGPRLDSVLGAPPSQRAEHLTETDVIINLPSVTRLISAALKTNSKRIAIDSLSTLKMFYGDEVKKRRMLFRLMEFLYDSGCTCVLTSETTEDTPSLENYISDGVLKMHTFIENGRKRRAIEIQKMRGTGFDEDMRPLKITSSGIEVYNEELFTEGPGP
jgi:KaiC/GvpD/RAD55 family RecA-like ATPase